MKNLKVGIVVCPKIVSCVSWGCVPATTTSWLVRRQRKNREIRRIGVPFRPHVDTPRGPPSGKTGDFLFIGDVMYRKITSDFAWGCTPFLCPRWRVMSQSSDVSKSLDFQLVVFCEQMGCHFCNFGGVPLQPPVSYPPSANPPKPFGRELEKTVSFQVFTTPGL